MYIGHTISTLVCKLGLLTTFFGFESGTEYTDEDPGIGSAFSRILSHMDDTFTVKICAENIIDLTGWQFDVTFDPARLEAFDMREGDFVSTSDGSTFSQKGHIDNAIGKITGLSVAGISIGGPSESGSQLRVTFWAQSEAETVLVSKTLSLAQ
jgi:hypothetical protein